MNRPDRRQIILGLSATAVLPTPAYAKNKSKVVIVGGGFGGASAAMHFRKIAPQIDVTLIEPNKIYKACPFSNLVLAGERYVRQQIFVYDGLKKAGIEVIQDRATEIDPDSRTISLARGKTLDYNKLILSPGIDFRPDAIQGCNQVSMTTMPHAWKAGVQTLILKQGLEALPDGGVFAISVPPAPFRCPPGPYERASLIAHYFKNTKPRSKILILDAQDSFSKQSLFEAAWTQKYGDMIERIPGSESGQVIRIDGQNNTLHTDFDDFKVDLANVIPPQKAGHIAKIAGVTDASGWCPINPIDFESSLIPNIHIIGDATIAAPMPKSAFSANLQGKICAMQIARLLSGKPAIPTVLTNTCYSYSDPDNAFSVTGVYNNKDGILTPAKGAGGMSPVGDFPELRTAEAAQARDWFRAITSEAFG